jgi:CDGSH-type Zn-finger protein
MTMSATSIECNPNGPYLVKNVRVLKNSRGESLPARPTMGLCRCGGSSNKPFCDGTHSRNGFSSARTTVARPDVRKDYRGQGIVIHDDRTLCAHAAQCTERLASVFRYGSAPWIDPDGAVAGAIVETIRRCPSGALSYTLDGVEGPCDPGETTITVTKDGPYAVVGAVEWDDRKLQRKASLQRWALCRCGASNNKPFCDGSHAKIGFKDERN